MNLVEGVLQGNIRAMARLISIVENEHPGAMQAMKNIFPHTGKAYIVGFTGPPGAGKSTLVDKVTLHFCRQEKKVGVIAVDPSSPFSGGALLGDRIRMRDITSQEQVFIRSLSTRGCMGGISSAAGDIVKIMDASGKDYVLIETVGVGQDEVDIFKIADTSVVVLMPGAGDDIQSIKAGIMEIGDIFVVNKADREGVERLEHSIHQMLAMNPEPEPWKPPIVKTVATKGVGIPGLINAIAEHRAFLDTKGHLESRRKARIRTEVIRLVEKRISKFVHAKVQQNGLLDSLVEKAIAGQENPYSCAEKIVAPLEKQWIGQ